MHRKMNNFVFQNCSFSLATVQRNCTHINGHGYRYLNALVSKIDSSPSALGEVPKMKRTAISRAKIFNASLRK
ncbi:MAG: hypothetical protein B7Y39_02540 [Bdellovibrio sp. 28-41-41]|nr:MAG: hypothetical protein B7Y39_02540 [Bdellovibrio sp. 28-41-41]